jgi:ATP-dependent RNA helicase RhlE
LLRDVGEGSVLVFTRTKHRAKRLAEKLDGMGYSTTSLQGNLSQNRRREAMEGFRNGRYKVMIATDIAARGIDISTVSHVINFDVPDTVEAYTHRVGRTGRASRNGDAFTLITQADEEMVRCIERVFPEKLERRRLADFSYTQEHSAAPGRAGGSPSGYRSRTPHSSQTARRSRAGVPSRGPTTAHTGKPGAPRRQSRLTTARRPADRTDPRW